MILGCIYFIYTSLEEKLPDTRSFFNCQELFNKSQELYNKSQELEAEARRVHPGNKVCFFIYFLKQAHINHQNSFAEDVVDLYGLQIETTCYFENTWSRSVQVLGKMGELLCDIFCP